MTTATYSADHWSQRAVSDEGLERYLHDNLQPYSATKNALLEDILGSVNGQRILDYGGGAGYFGVRCATRGAHVTIVDPAAAALKLANRLATHWDVASRVETTQSSWIPEFPNTTFDVVLLKDIIEHIPEDAALLSRVAELQRPGGRLLLSTHNQWSLNYLIEGNYNRWWLGDRNWLGWDPTHVRFYTPASINRLLRNAGYRATGWASVYIVPYTLPQWLTLLRVRSEWPWLSWVDRMLGNTFPFNRLGWNVCVCAERT